MSRTVPDWSGRSQPQDFSSAQQPRLVTRCCATRPRSPRQSGSSRGQHVALNWKIERGKGPIQRVRGAPFRCPSQRRRTPPCPSMPPEPVSCRAPEPSLCCGRQRPQVWRPRCRRAWRLGGNSWRSSTTGKSCSILRRRWRSVETASPTSPPGANAAPCSEECGHIQRRNQLRLLINEDSNFNPPARVRRPRGDGTGEPVAA